MNALELSALEAGERLAEMKRILTEELPADNYFVLKYIVHFLTEVETASSVTYLLFASFRKSVKAHLGDITVWTLDICNDFL